MFGEAHLRRILKSYAEYYNQVRTPLALDKDAPDFRRQRLLGSIIALPVLHAGMEWTQQEADLCLPKTQTLT